LARFSVNLNVAPGGASASVAVTPAASFLVQPGHGAVGVTPVGEDKGHTFLEGVLHGVDIALVVVADIKVIVAVTLAKLDVDGTFLEGSPLGVGLVGVNALARTVTISPPIPGVSLTTTTVARANVTTFGGVAVVRSGLGNKLVCFHDIHLPAPDATDLVGITVVVTTLRWIRLPAGVVARHSNKVEGSIARAAYRAKINVVLDSLAHERVALEVVRAKITAVFTEVSTGTVVEGH